MKKRVIGILIVLWMAVIFLFSAQSAVKSSKVSQSTAYRIAEWQNRVWKQKKTEQELTAQAERMQFAVRKGAHMSEYAVLSVLFLLYFMECSKEVSFFQKNLSSETKRRRRKIMCLAWGLTVCYAATDEIHQLFVPGRAGRISDVCIDGIGALAGILFIIFLHFPAYFLKKI